MEAVVENTKFCSKLTILYFWQSANSSLLLLFSVHLHSNVVKPIYDTSHTLS